MKDNLFVKNKLDIKQDSLCMFLLQHRHKVLDRNSERMSWSVERRNKVMGTLQHIICQRRVCIQKLCQDNFRDTPIKESHHNILKNIDWHTFDCLDLQKAFMYQDIFKHRFLLSDQHKNQKDIVGRIYQLYFMQIILVGKLLHRD